MRTLFVASCVLLVVCHCGGKAESKFDSPAPPDAASSEGGGDAGIACLGSGHGPPASPPSGSRPSAPTCPRTPNPDATPDAAPPAPCNTDADCTGTVGTHCAEHLCGYDQCLVDSDCPSSQVCVCNDMAGGGIGRIGSECVPADCRTDSDCGAGNYCVASRGYCGGVGGYNCTSSHDTCVDPTKDCAACGGNTCAYNPMVGHFACATTNCAG